MGEIPPQLLKYVFKKGHKPMGGRKKGKTLKEFAREYLASMELNERLEFLNSIDPDLVWRMAEGNPHSTEDITTGGKPFQPPIYGGLSRNSISKQDILPEKEDTGN